MTVQTLDLSRALAIEGFMSVAELTWLADQASHAQIIVEIGAFQGRSTRALADHCSGVVYSIDPFDGYVNDDGTQATWITSAYTWAQLCDRFAANLADHLATGRVVPIRAKSAEAVLPVTQADLVFIDGDHHEDVVHGDILKYWPMVRAGGVLAGHDYGHSAWPGVQRAVDALFPTVQHCESIWWKRA